ncbi:hypothetical protein ACIBG8_05365 [Nonomuraea sp. NPDC050556]|uniref:hypothetical protein n=1 Tax=Nonomuraea sp. NPDC050556 TaxID=3364369 RepID=UPI00379ECB83
MHAARNGLGLGNGSRVPLRPHLDPGFRGIASTHNTEDVWTFACTFCGYTETYILGPEPLEFIRRNWPPVPPTQNP